MIETLGEKVNADTYLVHQGRFVDTSFLIEDGDQQWLVTIAQGAIVEIRKGPLVMPRWTFALRAESDAWADFWSAVPPPGANDLFALLKHRRLRIDGDAHPFMANLFYFKDVMAKLRAAA